MSVLQCLLASPYAFTPVPVLNMMNASLICGCVSRSNEYVECPAALACAQANNTVVRTFGERRQEEKLHNHVDLVEMLNIVNLEKGQEVGKGMEV